MAPFAAIFAIAIAMGGGIAVTNLITREPPIPGVDPQQMGWGAELLPGCSGGSACGQAAPSRRDTDPDSAWQALTHPEVPRQQEAVRRPRPRSAIAASAARPAQ